jgi:cytochrome c551/c552
MKVPIMLALFLSATQAFGAEPPPSLTHYRCYICHSDQQALVGPAFADVAAAYRGRRDAVTQIAKDIRAGMRTGGPWHMPPHPEVSPEEARAMARYIMSLAPQEAKTQPAKQPK